VTTDRTQAIEGSCHCGNIRYVLHWPGLSSEIPVRECGCTFCQKHGGAWTSNRAASLTTTIEDRSRVSRYKFGTATANFYVCSTCGVVPFVTSEIDDALYAVVNTNSFDDGGALNFSRSSTDFSGEDVDARLERRKQNWIPDVYLPQLDL